jgi:hypothetical protein
MHKMVAGFQVDEVYVGSPEEQVKKAAAGSEDAAAAEIAA